MPDRRPITAPEGQGVTFVELFFDLVFVFAFTQVTALVAHHLTLGGVVQGVLVFWMIWWAWTQFTWALNPADTNHGQVRIGTLAATAVAFVMSISVGNAFEDGGAWFIVPYVIVRTLGLGLYLKVSSEHEQHLVAVRTFALLSLLGLASALAGGFVDPSLRIWFWAGTIVLDFIAAGVGGRTAGWELHLPHFTERHGLFVIIALGESLIAAGVGAVALRTPDMMPVAIAAVVLTCILWWSYFGWFKDDLEEAFEETTPEQQAPFARDAYSFLHFPMLAGVIGIAVAVEELMKHPTDPVHTETLIALGAGIFLFAGSAGLAHFRARKKVLATRFVCLGVLIGALYLLGHAQPVVILGAAIIAVLALVLVEGRAHKN